MNMAMDISNNEKMHQYDELQYNSLQNLSELFKKFIYQIDRNTWEEIVMELENVLSRCDEIDYQSDATAIAYAVFHFLDRYHRVQIMCRFLMDNGYINRPKQYDILDVGTGPSQVLFAMSDHFHNINLIENEELCTVIPDYVEQSFGFRNYLHHFVEFALSEGILYSVPFHLGRTRNVTDIKFNENRPDWFPLNLQPRLKNKCIKYRYDITVFNNFLTKMATVESCANTFQEICQYTRNHGLVIIVGASEKIKKYSGVYPMIDEIVLRPVSDKGFQNHWDKVFDQEFTYTYNDDYGKIICDYFRELACYLQDKNLWESVPPIAKKEIVNRANIWTQGNESSTWNGITWKMVVYRKNSKPKYKVKIHKTHSYAYCKSVDRKRM